jgi:uncharacterized phage protein gp47/JayE
VPFPRPTLAELIERIRGDLRGRLEIGGPLLRRAMVDIVGAAWAGAVHSLYGYLDWIFRQMFADTAEREQLLREARLWGITPTPATFATGTATVTGTTSTNGTVIPAGTIYRLDATTSYRVTTGQTIASNTATLPLTAVNAGSAANVPAGALLTLESPIAGVASTAAVAADIVDGIDEEGTDEVRDRFLLRLREPPEGGADQDYEAWALAVAGVTRAWVYPNELGLGTVVVRFVMDGETSIFPDSTAVAAVQAKLDAERPATDEPTAMAPVELAVDFTISVTPNTADVKAAVEAELADLFRRLAEPGAIVKLSQVRTAIGIAEGVTDYVLTAPSADVVPAIGELPVVGTVSWP